MYVLYYGAFENNTYYALIPQIQKMVISGGDFKPDALKPKEMVSLLLDDEEMETRCKNDQ